MEVCRIVECKSEVHAKLMCEMHYRQILHGKEITRGRANDWGMREKHPLFSHWSTIRRRSIKAEMCKEWHTNFWKFVQEVGERPGKEYMLTRKDISKPYFKDNFYWREKIILKKKNETEKEYLRRWARAYRVLHPEKHKDYDLKKSYGISLIDYNKILEKQNGVCAICEKKETAINNKTGNPRHLAVDHCHESGKTRGILCTNCNMVIGNARSSIEVLEKAIKYLKKNQLVVGGCVK